jgi:hypothetical protein
MVGQDTGWSVVLVLSIERSSYFDDREMERERTNIEVPLLYMRKPCNKEPLLRKREREREVYPISSSQ